MSRLPDAASPLYEKVKDYVLANIENGAWRRDARLPSENDLVQSLGVSRMTINRALRELTIAGVLVRVQGVGTFVAAPKPRSALLEIANIAAEIAARGHAHRAAVLALDRFVPESEILASFEFPGARPVLHSLVLHFEDERPVQLEERFVNPDLVPDYLSQDFTAVTTYDYLQGVTPLTEIEHVISAVAADADSAAHLGIEVGEPCLLLHRRTWTGTVVATVNRLTYAGKRTSLGSRYSLESR
jgi:GntR family histidine utilization transcriptional repressor